MGGLKERDFRLNRHQTASITQPLPALLRDVQNSLHGLLRTTQVVTTWTQPPTKVELSFRTEIS